MAGAALMRPADTLPYRKITDRLLKWWRKNKREFPWRCTSDPYRVIVAAVLLRRTNAYKVNLIYTDFLRKYPDITSLARAEVSELADFLKPLGLYNIRARELKEIAAQILRKYGGYIPADPSELMKIKGVGRYIASAVACFAYGKPVSVVDAVVARVISRVAGLKNEHGSISPIVWSIAEEFVKCGSAVEINLALMDLAALICLPKNPRCSKCPVRGFCKSAIMQHK